MYVRAFRGLVGAPVCDSRDSRTESAVTYARVEFLEVRACVHSRVTVSPYVHSSALVSVFYGVLLDPAHLVVAVVLLPGIPPALPCGYGLEG